MLVSLTCQHGRDDKVETDRSEYRKLWSENCQIEGVSLSSHCQIGSSEHLPWGQKVTSKYDLHARQTREPLFHTRPKRSSKTPANPYTTYTAVFGCCFIIAMLQEHAVTLFRRKRGSAMVTCQSHRSYSEPPRSLSRPPRTCTRMRGRWQPCIVASRRRELSKE